MKRRVFLGVAATGLGAAGITGVVVGRRYFGRGARNGYGPAMYYAERDRQIVDYALYTKGSWLLRGPDPGPLQDRNYLTYVGASQTFGPYTSDPFPARVSAALGMKHLNLGVGGAGPGYFSSRLDSLLEWLNRSRFVVLQVMSARSAGNSQMRLVDGNRWVVFRGKTISTEQAWEEVISDSAITPASFWTLVDETRADWLRAYDLLLGMIEVPILLLNIGTRPPIDREDRSVVPVSRAALFGPFPQLVTRDMIESIAGRCARYVECISSEGLPQTLRDRISGEILGKNDYYPSPEIHAQVARQLVPVCRELFRA